MAFDRTIEDTPESVKQRVKAQVGKNLYAVIKDYTIRDGVECTSYLKNTRGQKIKKVCVYTALLKHNGDVIAALKSLDVDNYGQLVMFLERDEEAKKLRAALKKSLCYKAENVLLNSLDSPDQKLRIESAKFILKTLGKNDGWMEGPSINVDMRNMKPEDTKKAVQEIFGITEGSQDALGALGDKDIIDIQPESLEAPGSIQELSCDIVGEQDGK